MTGFGLAVAAITGVLDQASKLWLLFVYEIGTGRGAVRVTPFFDLVLTWNTGISYGSLQQDGVLFGQWALLVLKVVAVGAAGDLAGPDARSRRPVPPWRSA